MFKSSAVSGKLLCALLATGLYATGNYAVAEDHNGYIPSNTPYYMGTGEGLPVDLMLAFTPSAEFPVPDDIEPEGREAIEKMTDIINNLDTILPEWGVGEKLHFSSYAVGIYPVLRVKLDDPEKFNESLNALEAAHEVESQVLEKSDYSVRFYNKESVVALTESNDDKSAEQSAGQESNGDEADDKPAAGAGSRAGVIVATNKNDLIVSLVSDGKNDALIDRVLGVTRPADSMLESGKLDKIRKRWDYGNQYAAYLDMGVVTDIMTSEKSDAAKDIAALSRDDASFQARLSMMRSEPCRAEINSLAANWPMVVMGIRELDYSTDELRYVTHVASEIGHTQLKETLQLLRGVLPMSQSATRALLSLGLGLSVDNLTQFIGQMTGLLTAVNYQCPMLTNLNRASSADLSAASMGVVMFGGLARGVEGIGINVFDLVFSPDSGAVPVKGADMAVVVNAKDPQVLIQTLQMMPQMGMLAELPLDGSEIVLNDKLPLPLPEGIELKAAVKENSIVMFAGEKSAEYISRLANNNEGGFFRAQVDITNILEKATAAMEMFGGQSDQLDDMMAYMKGYPKGQIDYSVDFTDNGIELLSSAVIERPEEAK